jgi:uncharacterized protein YkwD
MRKLIAITTSTVLLSLLGATGFNFVPTQKVYAATTSCTTQGSPLVYKSINLSNCKNATEVVKKLRACGLTNITTANVKNIKALKTIINKINKKATTTKTATTKPTTTKPTTTTTTKPATTTSTSTSNSTTSSYAAQVLQLVNKERAKEGLSALTTNNTITAAGNVRAKEIVQSFSHTRPNGSSPFTALSEAGITYRAAGENIAYGQRTPQEVVTGWMNSPGHRANIMNPSFGKVGIGVYKDSNGTIYWTQLFTN